MTNRSEITIGEKGEFMMIPSTAKQALAYIKDWAQIVHQPPLKNYGATSCFLANYGVTLKLPQFNGHSIKVCYGREGV